MTKISTTAELDESLSTIVVIKIFSWTNGRGCTSTHLDCAGKWAPPNDCADAEGSHNNRRSRHTVRPAIRYDRESKRRNDPASAIVDNLAAAEAALAHRHE